MRLWTIQDKAAYDDLCEKGILHCNAALADWLKEDNFKQSYDWFVSEMKERVGEPPHGVAYPIWAWYLLFGKNTKPDLRRFEFKNYVGEQYIIEAEIPDTNALLSDEELWHLVLNNGYFAKHAGKHDAIKEYEAEEDYFNRQPACEQEWEKQKSRKNIFDKTYCPRIFVQATFWELRKEQIISVRKFYGRAKPTK